MALPCIEEAMQGRAVIRELSLQNSPDFIACPLAIRTKAYRSTIVLVASCKLPANHGAIEYTLQPLPTAAMRSLVSTLKPDGRGRGSGDEPPSSISAASAGSLPRL